MRRTLALAYLLLACAPDRAAEVPKASATVVPNRTASLINIELNPLADYYFYLRKVAVDPVLTAPPYLADTVSAVHTLNEALGSSAICWTQIEVPMGSAKTAEELERAYDVLPGEVSTAGRKVPLRELGLRFARALREGEPGFMNNLWPEHKRLLEARRAGLRQQLHPIEKNFATEVDRRLGLRFEGGAISLQMVLESPVPSDHADTPPAVGLHALQSTGASDKELVEEALVELVHALNAQRTGKETVFDDLRRALKKRDIDEASSPSSSEIVNIIALVESGEIMRSFDPKYVTLGESTGFYDASRPLSAVVVPRWKKFALGAASRSDTVSEISDQVSLLKKK